VVDDGFEADVFDSGEVEGFLLVDGPVGGSGEPGLHGGLMLFVHESGYDFLYISVHKLVFADVKEVDNILSEVGDDAHVIGIEVGFEDCALVFIEELFDIGGGHAFEGFEEVGLQVNVVENLGRFRVRL
jgi:hypothetical protein